MHKVARDIEKKILKEEIKTMIKELGISKRYFLKKLPKMTGRGYDYKVPKRLMGSSQAGGHKASLRQQAAFLRNLIVADKDMKVAMKQQMKEIKEGQAEKKAMIDMEK